MRQQGRQRAAQLLLQAVDQLVDDVVEVDLDALLLRQAQDGLTGRHVEAVDGA